MEPAVSVAMARGRLPLLVVNSHEAWVYQLGVLGVPLVIVDGMPGRHVAKWDLNARPVPRGAKLITADQIVEGRQAYECMIGHSVSDLLVLKRCVGPRLLVIHSTLEGRASNQDAAIPEGFAETTRDYLAMVGAHAVAVSALKARSWGFIHDTVPFCVEQDAYLPYSGALAEGIRVANHIQGRREYLHWDFHQAAMAGIPVRLVGHNPGMEGVEPSKDWSDLKSTLVQYRFYVHTAHPTYEDGYNMASMEAMASGLPVLGNRHPTSPIEHGVSGFLSDDPAELGAYARRLLEDRELAAKMGQAAKRAAAKCFSTRGFVDGLRKAVAKAQKKWKLLERRAA